MIFKNGVLPAWELIFRGFLFFRVIWIFRGHLENSSFTCMGAQFWRPRSTFFRFFEILGHAKKSSFRLPVFFLFFYHYWWFFGGLGVSFGVLLEPLSSLLACWCHSFGCVWLAWAVCGLFLLFFVVHLARLGCLWAQGPLQDRFLLHLLSIFGLFSEEFGDGI